MEKDEREEARHWPVLRLPPDYKGPASVLGSASRQLIKDRIGQFKPEGTELLIDVADRLLVRFAHAAVRDYPTQATLNRTIADAVAAHRRVAYYIGTMRPEVATRFFLHFHEKNPKLGLQKYARRFERAIEALKDTMERTEDTGRKPLYRWLVSNLIHLWNGPIAHGDGGNPKDERVDRHNAGRAFIHTVLIRAKEDAAGLEAKFPAEAGALKKLADRSDETIKAIIKKPTRLTERTPPPGRDASGGRKASETISQADMDAFSQDMKMKADALLTQIKLRRR